MNGALVDGGWYLAVLGFARDTPWLHALMDVYTNVGLVVFAVLLVLRWWRARRAAPTVMAAALWSPVAVVLAYLVSNLVKITVREPRPCRSIPHLVTLHDCPAPTDYAFPSNHAVLAAAAAVALCVTWRRVGVTAVVLALLMGFSRVYVGAHYPHDVLAGFVVGIAVAATVPAVAGRLADPVSRLRTHPRWVPWIGPAPRHGQYQHQS